MNYAYNIADQSLNGNYSGITTSIENYPSSMMIAGSKKSFLVFRHNKYINVAAKSIAFFYIKFDTTIIVTFDNQEYAVNYSLDQIQTLVAEQQFFRINRQYLINFAAIKEVEHYFARKLLAIPIISVKEKLIVSKERARPFLDWLENR